MKRTVTITIEINSHNLDDFYKILAMLRNLYYPCKVTIRQEKVGV